MHRGSWASANYLGNLVPFSGGLAYEENPTITYAPVQGEKYVRQLLSPIALDLLLLVMRSVTNPAMYLTVLANKINDMRSFWFIRVAWALVHAFTRLFVYFLFPGGNQREAMLDVLDRTFPERVRTARRWCCVTDDAGKHFTHGCNDLVLFGQVF